MQVPKKLFIPDSLHSKYLGLYYHIITITMLSKRMKKVYPGCLTLLNVSHSW